MAIDSYKWLPGSLANYYKALPLQKADPMPWTPLAKPIEECRFSLVTTAGLYVKGKQQSFDLDGERKNPFWGDPTYRAIPRDVKQEEIGVAHHHINTADLEADVNIALPVHRFLELESAGEIGSLAPTHYSFMGYQGYPPNSREWENRYGPEVAARMKEEGVDAVLLTPV
jgi:D-proline reductase (dithiol) PrdB